ncbi:MAG: ABC transporter permease [Candidatus Pacebacteria bacterium]|nr:ABC transporter permease [Candidatus Paceibacterota bacterium]
MSLHLDLKRIFREGLISFWRNRIVSFSSVLVMTMSLLTLSSLLFLSGVLDFTLAQFQERVDINIYFFPDAPVQEIKDLEEKIKLIPEVRDVVYVSKEEALINFEKRHADDDLIKRSLEELGDNPLGASLNIRAHESTQYESVVKSIESEPLVKNAEFVERINYNDNKNIIERLNQFTSIVQNISYAVILFLSIISVLVLISTMRIAIYASRDEIIVKRLVGAEHRYIRGPFAVIGSLYGFIAAIITMISLFPITRWLSGITKTFFGGMDIATYFMNNLLQFAVIIISVGIILGFFSSILAVRKYLRV